MKLSLGLSPRDYSVAGAVAYDADAQAYFTANTAITSSADKNAINTFYLGLKTDGIYTKIKAMYLPIWGSAASSKWNLINNRSFDLSFTVNWLYTSQGILGDGASTYADTFVNPTTVLTLNSTHLSIYSRTSTASSNWQDIGNTVPPAQFSISAGYANVAYSDCYNYNTGRISQANTDAKGFYLQSRTTSAIHKFFKNGSQFGTTNTGASGSFTNQSIYIGAIRQSSSAPYNSARQYSFASIGDGLTDAEASNFYTRVNTLMTYFGINV